MKDINQLHLNAMYNLCPRRYIDAVIQPGRKKNEYDVTVPLKITRSQTKDIKQNPRIYKFIAQSTPLDYIDYENKHYDITLRTVWKAMGIETSFRELKFAVVIRFLFIFINPFSTRNEQILEVVSFEVPSISAKNVIDRLMSISITSSVSNPKSRANFQSIATSFLSN